MRTAPLAGPNVAMRLSYIVQERLFRPHRAAISLERSRRPGITRRTAPATWRPECVAARARPRCRSGGRDRGNALVPHPTLNLKFDRLVQAHVFGAAR